MILVAFFGGMSLGACIGVLLMAAGILASQSDRTDAPLPRTRRQPF
jgi:hypothetical protein